jgi:hypothetical protein
MYLNSSFRVCTLAPLLLSKSLGQYADPIIIIIGGGCSPFTLSMQCVSHLDASLLPLDHTSIFQSKYFGLGVTLKSTRLDGKITLKLYISSRTVDTKKLKRWQPSRTLSNRVEIPLRVCERDMNSLSTTT